MRLVLPTVSLWATMVFAVAPLRAQDSTQVYPWRLSYFPYVTASPNDGVMGMARMILFRQSRWDDRVSLQSSVALEGGYSTKDAWLARARGDFPRLVPGWRLQVIGQAGREREYYPGVSADRQMARVEVTRTLSGPVAIALSGRYVHVADSVVTSSDWIGRLAMVVDTRDREYDTRSGLLVQFGAFIDSHHSAKGGYGLASGWLSIDDRTRLTARLGIHSAPSYSSDEAQRTMPAWEDEYVLGGGPHSNRGLPIGVDVGRNNALASGEIRRDLKVFPGGAVAVLAFVDASRGYCAGCIQLTDIPLNESVDWKVSPGAGVSLRLLRNAILTATVAHGDGATRFYVSSGWSW